MSIILNGTTGITTPDVSVTAQSSNIITSGNIEAVNATLSGGVYVGGTAAANHLDDYEEGTWTLEFYDANTGGNVSSSTVTGKYTKIGDVVHIYIDTTLNNISTAGMTSENVLYFTLPFTPRTNIFSGSMTYDNITMPAGRTQLAPLTSGGRGIFKGVGSNVGDFNARVVDIQSGVTDIITLSMTYTTAS